MLTKVYKEDIEEILSQNLLSELEGKKVFVSGATGLLGQMIVRTLIEQNKYCLYPIRIIALVRDKKKAEMIFGLQDSNILSYVVGDICNFKTEDMELDYIIHGASRTASKDFIQEPIETTLTAILGTKNMLDLATINHIRGFVFLSSMEVYGTPKTDRKIKENFASNVNTMEVRSCYPESKRLCENLCVSYLVEKKVPVKVVRLTQTFGPGVEYTDSRVFAEFARCVIEKRNIILHTKGNTKRAYLYIRDAVTAIFTVLLKGEVGEAYNAANMATYCSIYEMALTVAEKCSNSAIRVEIRETDTSNLGYAQTLKMNLDVSKLEALGWKACEDLQGMYKRMIADMKERVPEIIAIN